jgi:hypothetical protein
MKALTVKAMTTAATLMAAEMARTVNDSETPMSRP